MDDARKRAERKAFEQLLGQFRTEWGTVVMTYNKGAGRAAVR
jgi:hypothetical protein